MSNRNIRQSFLGEHSQKTIDTSTVGIIGLCGGGSHVAQQLAHIGIGKLHISDFDKVDPSNLNRMIGSKPADADNGAFKTDVIERMILEINPNVEVTKLNGTWQEHVLALSHCDVIVGCVDKYSERDGLERFCRQHKIHYVDIGMDVYAITGGYSISGQVIVSAANGPCMRCLGFLTDTKLALEQANYNEAGGKPQVVWPNGVLASIAVGQVMGLLLPWNLEMKPSVMIEYDGNRQTLRASTKLEHLSKQKCIHFQ
jgi:molybdopterin/thiamine biosynthesis adenylyltransferase